MDRLLDYIKDHSKSKLIQTAIDVARKSPEIQEDMLLYIFKYLTEENAEMEATIKKLLSTKK
jgi:hypothetical protein